MYRARVTSGETVLVHGASGAVSDPLFLCGCLHCVMSLAPGWAVCDPLFLCGCLHCVMSLASSFSSMQCIVAGLLLPLFYYRSVTSFIMVTI